MKNFKIIFITIFLLIIYIFLSVFSYSTAVSNNLSNNIFRLHIIANSNSKEDQELKFIVRDKLIEYMKSVSYNIYTKEDAINFVTQNIDTFKSIVEDVVAEKGFDYSVDIAIGNFEFPTKTYDNFSFPAGFYDALKVKLGNANGKNWWCVMFPSLCFVNTSDAYLPEDSQEKLESNLDLETYNLISSKNHQYKLKFKLVELFDNAKVTLAKK